MGTKCRTSKILQRQNDVVEKTLLCQNVTIINRHNRRNVDWMFLAG
jgi:hypothetical protein